MGILSLEATKFGRASPYSCISWDRTSGNLGAWGEIELYTLPGVADFSDAWTEKVSGELHLACYDMEPSAPSATLMLLFHLILRSFASFVSQAFIIVFFDNRLVLNEFVLISLVESIDSFILRNFTQNMYGLLVLALEQDSNRSPLHFCLPGTDILVSACFR